jgi:hypothetical protein
MFKYRPFLRSNIIQDIQEVLDLKHKNMISPFHLSHKKILTAS